MTLFYVLLKKELLGHWRSYRVLGIAAVFLFFAGMTPLLDHFLPQILASQNLDVTLPDYTPATVLVDYLDSMGQVGLIAAILMAMGAIAREREQGTASMLLCKPVNRSLFITSKLMSLGGIFLLGIVVGAVVSYFYTVVLFGSASILAFIFANLLALFYILLCLAVTLTYSTLFKSQLAAGALALVSLIGLAGISAIPIIREYSPGAIISWSKAVVTGDYSIMWPTLGVGLAVIAVSLLISWRSFNKAEV